jgi:hypothetical protein
MTTPDAALTPQQAFQTLVQELSASGSQPLQDNDGSLFTLRGAIARILWKVNFLLPLINRPLPPTQTDDLYGHVLSMRAEGLITQALVTDMAARVGSDVATIRANVLANLTPPASS